MLYIQSLASQYTCVSLLDYQGWGDEFDFWNATHLNTEGARRFSRELMTNIDK